MVRNQRAIPFYTRTGQAGKTLRGRIRLSFAKTGKIGLKKRSLGDETGLMLM
jgi:hypothetical protein